MKVVVNHHHHRHGDDNDNDDDDQKSSKDFLLLSWSTNTTCWLPKRDDNNNNNDSINIRSNNSSSNGHDSLAAATAAGTADTTVPAVSTASGATAAAANKAVAAVVESVPSCPAVPVLATTLRLLTVLHQLNNNNHNKDCNIENSKKADDDVEAVQKEEEEDGQGSHCNEEEEEEVNNNSEQQQQQNEDDDEKQSKDNSKDSSIDDDGEIATSTAVTSKEKNDNEEEEKKMKNDSSLLSKRQSKKQKQQKQQQELVEDDSMQHFTRRRQHHHSDDIATLIESALKDIQHYRQRQQVKVSAGNDNNAQPVTMITTDDNDGEATAAGKKGRDHQQQRGGGGGGGREQQQRRGDALNRRNEQRMQALEHQRDRQRRRLDQEKRTSRSSTSSASGCSDDDDNDDDDNNEDNNGLDHDDDDADDNAAVDTDDNAAAAGGGADEDNANNEENVELSWHRIGRTLNSLAILTPLLLDAFTHSRRNDKTLCIRNGNNHTHDIVNKNKKNKRGRVSESCWLFFEQKHEPYCSLHVFDIISVKKCKYLYHELLHIWSMLLYGLAAAAASPAAAPTTSPNKRRCGRYIESLTPDKQDLVVAHISKHWRPVMNKLMQQVCRLYALELRGGGGVDSENDVAALSSWSDHGWIHIASPLLPWHNQHGNDNDNDDNASNLLENHHDRHPLAKLDIESQRRLSIYLQQLDVHVGFRNNDKNKAAREKQLQEQYQQAITKLHRRTLELLRNRFTQSRHEIQLSVYGSCYSNLSNQNSDVDMSLHLPEMLHIEEAFLQQEYTVEKYDAERRKLVYQACRKLENTCNNNNPYNNNNRHRNDSNSNKNNKPEYRNMQPVTRARVPVIKGTFLHANNPYSHDGSMDFDICFCNEIAVQNSRLLREYSLVTTKTTTTRNDIGDGDGGGVVRQVMMAVKHWAKSNQISSAADNTLSSYTWMNLVIYYCIYINLVPNLQCPALQKQVVSMKEASSSDKRPNGDDDAATAVAATNVNNNSNNKTMQQPSTDGLDISFVTWKEAKQVWTPPSRPPAALSFLQSLPKQGSNDDDSCSISMYLYGFFYFYTHVFPVALFGISIHRGGGGDEAGDSGSSTTLGLLPKTAFSRGTKIACCMSSFSVEDPFERYDSHKPHDLGSHADDRGFQRIAQCFQRAEMEWRTLLVQLAAPAVDTISKDDIDDKVKKQQLMMDMASKWHRHTAAVTDSAKTPKGEQQGGNVTQQQPKKGGTNGNKGKPHAAPQKGPTRHEQHKRHQQQQQHESRTKSGKKKSATSIIGGNKKETSAANTNIGFNNQQQQQQSKSKAQGPVPNTSAAGNCSTANVNNHADKGTNDNTNKHDKGNVSHGGSAKTAATSNVESSTTSSKNVATGVDDRTAIIIHPSSDGYNPAAGQQQRNNRKWGRGSGRGRGKSGRGGRGDNRGRLLVAAVKRNNSCMENVKEEYASY